MLKNQKTNKSIKTMRYIDLMFAYWDIRDKLRTEFPDKFYESNRLFALKMLNAELIECKHEQ